MANKDIEFINVLGVGKNGTTLLGSLLDNHPQISTFPMEMKFVEHFFNTIKDKSIEGIIRFLSHKSKLTLLGKQNHELDEQARVVVGNLHQINFNKNEFFKLIEKEKKNFNLFNNYKEILIFLHLCLDKYLKRKNSQKIVIQDGCFGLRYINEQIDIFKKIKFLIIVRNPLDTFVSHKKIKYQFKFFRRFIGDFSREEQMNTSRENLNYSIINKLYKKYKNNEKFHFLKYENLVSQPKSEMKKVADFIGIQYLDEMIKPTVFGQKWHGNSARVLKKENIDDKEVNKFQKNLNINEITFLELKFQKFFQNFNYQNHIKKFSKLRYLSCLLKIYFQNIFEAKKIIPSNNFLLKFAYYIIILNNLFLLRNMRLIVKL